MFWKHVQLHRGNLFAGRNTQLFDDFASMAELLFFCCIPGSSKKSTLKLKEAGQTLRLDV
jgi:hypothetical protein